MTLTAATMIYFERTLSKTKLDELISMAFFGRYIMLMFGLFSIYTGLIYNDMFSKALTWFPSMWEWDPVHWEGESVGTNRTTGYTYPFGLDWAWHDTEGELLFSNSYKMKMSILLGWAHVSDFRAPPGGEIFTDGLR
jgi:V-type H+-transporting ATPase subunit a